VGATSQDRDAVLLDIDVEMIMVTRRALLKAGVAAGLFAVRSGPASFFAAVAAAPGPYGDPRVFILNAQTLATVRDRIAANDPGVLSALKSHVNAATRLLTQAPVSVINKDRVPPSGDIHDYFSIGRYYWPDPTTPDGLPWIIRDGVVNPDVVSLPNQQDLEKLTTWVDALSLAYTFTGDERFAMQAGVLLRTWFLAPDTRMNPNLNYAANFPGHADGQSYGIIDTALFGRLVDNIGLIEHSPSWSDDDQAGIREWMSQYLDWLLTSPLGQMEGQAPNNHGTWYDVQVVALARFTGRDDVAQQVLQESVGKRIATQIAPDGRQPEELTRTTSLHYSMYNLTALCDLASLAATMYLDLWHAQTSDGRSIRGAIDFVLPYVLGQENWPYPQINTFSLTEFDLPLRQAATGYGNAGYWDAAEQIEGAHAATAQGRLLYLRPS
jgi:hypothetical protein